MVNKSLFQSVTSVLPGATVVNETDGPAYKYATKHALAHMVTIPFPTTSHPVTQELTPSIVDEKGTGLRRPRVVLAHSQLLETR